MMNRPGGVPQSLHGMPTGFGRQQPQQQTGRAAVSNRMPNGKLGNSGPNWAFGTGMSMAGGIPNSARQLGGNVSFAQSLSGSQPATPLDLSEFPSLSNASQLSSANPASMWASTGSRNLGGPVQRYQGTPGIPSQASQQDDIFSASSRMSSAQGSFRFGGQGAAQPPQSQPTSVDDFPPLSRNFNGDLGQDRGASLMSSLGFGSQAAASASTLQSRAGNGLLNALSANSRVADVRSPGIGPRPQDTRSPISEDEARRKSMAYGDETLAPQPPMNDGSGKALESRNPLGAIGKDAPSGKGKEEDKGRTNEGQQDPLATMAPIDKWGLKGIHSLINNFQDFQAITAGVDKHNLGFDLNVNEPISSQIYSLFSNVSPRPIIPKFRLPDCYQVKNVQPIEAKITSFNEETLMWIFYSNPGDVKQQMAAVELNNRNWRWHKKLQVWLTKDDMMHPQSLGPHGEQGFYIVWDTNTWSKVRQEIQLHYSDLDSSTAASVPTGA